MQLSSSETARDSAVSLGTPVVTAGCRTRTSEREGENRRACHKGCPGGMSEASLRVGKGACSLVTFAGLGVAEG
jgi:hypothetical protein